MNLQACIDHTILKPDARKEAIIALCDEAKANGFASVCVNPCFVPLCAQQLNGSDVKVCTVIGFPLGANRTKTKAFEASLAVEEGAAEVDMVINISALLDNDLTAVSEDIRAVVQVAHPAALVKVIIETCLLNDQQKKTACSLALEAGADFVKTSTGFSTGGASAGDIALMRAVVGERMGVKASGGVRTKEDALAMIAAGADRIGTSNGVAIVILNTD